MNVERGVDHPRRADRRLGRAGRDRRPGGWAGGRVPLVSGRTVDHRHPSLLQEDLAVRRRRRSGHTDDRGLIPAPMPGSAWRTDEITTWAPTTLRLGRTHARAGCRSTPPSRCRWVPIHLRCSPDQMREMGLAVVDMLIARIEGLRDGPVLKTDTPRSDARASGRTTVRAALGTSASCSASSTRTSCRSSATSTIRGSSATSPVPARGRPPSAT